MNYKVILLAASLVVAPGVAMGQPISEMAAGWNTVPTDGQCSTGTPYQFFVRPGTSDNLMVFFNPGGGCWFGQQCDLNAEPVTHMPFAQMDGNNPANFGGIFALDNSENPVADYTMVVLPYCTGDVHIGAGKREYSYVGSDGSDVSLDVFHNGAENTKTVLDWVYQNNPSPQNVVVAGSSAGAIGSSFYAGKIAEHYSETPVVLIADAAGGYNTPNLVAAMTSWDTASILPDWVEYAGETNATLNFEDFYIASANRNDNLTIAQINSANDSTQEQFTYLFGDAPGSFVMASRILNNYLEIESAVDSLTTYTNGGGQHVVLMGPQFYDYSVAGVRLRDWFAGLVAGENVADVSCVDEAEGCALAPE